MPIIISKAGRAVKVDRSEFDKEQSLQQFIYENPETIPLYEIKEDVRFLVLAKEFPTASGPIDAIGVDREGDIYCVETKLYKNPDKRLVVAQVLDYGASLWKTYRDFGTFVAAVNEKLALVGVTLQQRLTVFYGLNEEELASVLDNLRANLLEARFKFVVLMDQLHDQLKDLIVFLNQNSQFDIYAVEVDYYRHDGYEILIPKLYGAEVKKPGASPAKWDEVRFFDDAKRRLSKDQVTVLRQLYDSARKVTDNIMWGAGRITGSFSPKFQSISNKSPFSVFSNGIMILNFGSLNNNETVKYGNLFAQYLEETGRISIPKDYEKKFPNLPPEAWMPAAKEIIFAIQKLLKT